MKMRRFGLVWMAALVCISCWLATRSEGAVEARAVSLRVLQERLKARGERSREVTELAGLTRVVGYTVDETNRDLILLGEVEDGAPALHTEDLAVALRNAYYTYATRKGNTIYYEDPGCSIDPDPEVMAQLSALGDEEVSEEQMQEWCDICDEPQRVRVMGVPFDSRFAKVMVDADYLMKRLVDGSVDPGIPGFESLSEARYAMASDALEQGKRYATGTSMNRFWFYPGKTAFQEQEGVVTIESCPVTLLTEEQHLTQEGLTGMKRPDPMAQRFAESFSAHYGEIAAERAIYQELEQLFRMVALAKAAKYEQVKVNLDYLVGRFPAPKVTVARTLPGISRVRVVERRRDVEGGVETLTLWMPSCGGVNMGVKVGPKNFKRAPATKGKGGKATAGAKAGKKAEILKARPSKDALYWEVDRSKMRWN